VGLELPPDLQSPRLSLVLCRYPANVSRPRSSAKSQFWSLDEISRRLRREFPSDPTMQISHETIYQSLYVQGRGELRRKLARCLRSGRAQRRPQGFEQKRGKIPDMVMIAERPAEVADRAVPGHWEGDLIIGANHASPVGTLVERSTRSTRFMLLLHLGHDCSRQGGRRGHAKSDCHTAQ
jgi:IS30 family transposase